MTNEHPPGRWVRTGRGARFMLEPVNPAPYYNWRMCRRSFIVVQLALAATEGKYRAVECFNHAVDGGIVFG